MPIARVNGTVLHFIHVPKTGGASVTDYLRTKGKVALYSREPIAWARTTPQHMAAAAHRVMVPPGFADHAFLVLRDPVARMQSEFRYRAKRFAEGAGLPPPVGGGVMPLDLEDGRLFVGGFDDFVAHALGRVAADPEFADNHIRPQSDFWRPGARVFLFEDGLEEVFGWIDRVTGTGPGQRRPHSNRSPGIMLEMSVQTEAAIRAFYAADHALIEEVRDARWRAVAGAEEAPRPARIA